MTDSQSFFQKHKKSMLIFLYGIGIRLGFYLFYYIMQNMLNDRSGPLYFNDFLWGMRNWDGQHYLNLAENGYANCITNDQHLLLVFYPLYPWLIRALSFFIHNYALCGILISTFCFALGSVYFYKCFEPEIGEKATRTSYILLAIFPFSFFFGTVHTESLFFLISMLFFYHLQHKHTLRVAVLGALACLTKVQGTFLAFAVLVELFSTEHGIRLLLKKQWKDFWQKVLKPGLIYANMVWGFVGYLYLNYKIEGNPFQFMEYQRTNWYHSFAPIWRGLKVIYQQFTWNWYASKGYCIWLPELVLFFLFILAILYLFKHKMRPCFQTYLLVFYLITFSVDWLISAGRYTLSAFPFFAAGGIFLERHPGWKPAIYGISLSLLVLYYFAFSSLRQVY